MAKRIQVGLIKIPFTRHIIITWVHLHLPDHEIQQKTLNCPDVPLYGQAKSLLVQLGTKDTPLGGHQAECSFFLPNSGRGKNKRNGHLKKTQQKKT